LENKFDKPISNGLLELNFKILNDEYMAQVNEEYQQKIQEVPSNRTQASLLDFIGSKNND
jgi:hypothetical protein